MLGPSTFKTRVTLSASLALIAITMSGCSLTGKKPEIAATTTTPSGPRPASAAEAMQQATVAKQQRQARNGAATYVDPLVSARPGQNQAVANQDEIANGQTVRDFRASGRSAMTAMRSAKPRPSAPAQATAPAAVPELSESAMAGIVTQPTVIQAGRNSIFSAAAAPAADLTTSDTSASAPHVSSATGSLSTDAVAYAPVRRISGTSGGLFAGTPQMSENTGSIAATAPATASHALPGIATRPSVSAAAQPAAPGLW